MDVDRTAKRIKQLICGAGSGVITKTATAPLERVKILLQVQSMHTPHHERKYRGIINTMFMVTKEEGILSLYKGNGANVLRVIPVYALKFTFNDFFKDLVAGKDSSSKKLPFSKLIASGTLAGVFQTMVTYPLETIRTRLTLGKGLNIEYRGITDVFTKTLKQEGITGLYKGLGPTLLTGSPYVGLQMSFYEILTRQERYGLPEQVFKLIAGAVAGVAAQTITYPGDTIRRRMQTNGMQGKERVYKNSFDCLFQILRQEGAKCLFSGLTANVIRSIPGAGIQFWAYDNLKKLMSI
eukprot:maker-scaffold_12-snap-gene-12.1-mRNA-1 protein AED:0.02 eAED:0.02 QI:83/1/1/1/0.5/0.33/3/79/294